MRRFELLLICIALGGCNLIGGLEPVFKCEPNGSCQHGLACCDDGFCRADCSSTCRAGLPCHSNAGAPCRVGVTTCDGVTSVCVDGRSANDGTSCSDGVCSQGACVACTDGLLCTGNRGLCVLGALSCAGAGPVCEDGTVPVDAGTSCGPDQVCDPTGHCIACITGSPCASNPTPLCTNGVVDCSTGTPVCRDGAPRVAGTLCANDGICDGDGGCVVCTAGATCATNPDPCKTGTLVCEARASCQDDQPKSVGASCGKDQVCGGDGGCIACTAGLPCTTNPNACASGVTDCSTGAQTCIDGATHRPPGMACGQDQVCDGAGHCAACVPNGPCSTNPTPCKAGTQTCGSGPKCVDTAANASLGTACPGGFCDGSGACSSCALGSACSTNPSAPCKAGVLTRSGTSCVCADGPSANDGVMCAPTEYGMYVGCLYPAPCANEGNSIRTMTQHLCSAGSCNPVSGYDSMVCKRYQDGMSCFGGTCHSGSCTP